MPSYIGVFLVVLCSLSLQSWEKTLLLNSQRVELLHMMKDGEIKHIIEERKSYRSSIYIYTYTYMYIYICRVCV